MRQFIIVKLWLLPGENSKRACMKAAAATPPPLFPAQFYGGDIHLEAIKKRHSEGKQTAWFLLSSPSREPPVGRIKPPRGGRESPPQTHDDAKCPSSAPLDFPEIRPQKRENRRAASPSEKGSLEFGQRLAYMVQKIRRESSKFQHCFDLGSNPVC